MHILDDERLYADARRQQGVDKIQVQSQGRGVDRAAADVPRQVSWVRYELFQFLAKNSQQNRGHRECVASISQAKSPVNWFTNAQIGQEIAQFFSKGTSK